MTSTTPHRLLRVRPTLTLLAVLLSLTVPYSLAAEPDPLVGAWRYKGPRGEPISMVIVHECEQIAGPKELCHVEVAHLTPHKAPGFKRITMHLAIRRSALAASIVDRPRKALTFHPEGYQGALDAWRKGAATGAPKICEVDLRECL